jgi:hypothetical protein
LPQEAPDLHAVCRRATCPPAAVFPHELPAGTTHQHLHLRNAVGGERHDAPLAPGIQRIEEQVGDPSM